MKLQMKANGRVSGLILCFNEAVVAIKLWKVFSYDPIVNFPNCASTISVIAGSKNRTEKIDISVEVSVTAALEIEVEATTTKTTFQK